MRRIHWIIAGIVAVVLIIALVATIVLLSGTDAPAAAPTSTATSTATPQPTKTTTPTATPTPTPTAAPAPTRPSFDELVLTENTLGTVSLGSDPNGYDPATTIVQLESYDCGGGNSGSAWKPALFPSGSDRNAYQVGVDDSSTVMVITINDPTLRTDRGARPGMTWAEIAPLYPEAVDTTADGNGNVYAFETPSGTMFFYGGAEGGEVFTIGVTTHRPASDLRYANYHGLYAFCM